MGKVGNAIQMLNYLNTGNKYSAKDLANKLEISERMVRYYKNELEKSGIPIESFMGPNGGYYIINTNKFYNCFNKYDVQLLEDVKDILEKNDYIYKDKFNLFVNKVKTNYDIVEDESKYFQINNLEKETDIYNLINTAIKKHTKLNILYLNLNQEWKKRTIYPIQIFKYKNRLYVTAYCKLCGDIRHFELGRIKIIKT